MTSARILPENAEAIEMARNGMTAVQIAAAQKRSPYAVRHAISWAMRSEVLPAVAERRKRIDYLKRKTWQGTKVGSVVQDILLLLSDEALRWLISQTPKGGTLTDAIRGVVVDAYHDAQENTDG